MAGTVRRHTLLLAASNTRTHGQPGRSLYRQSMRPLLFAAPLTAVAAGVGAVLGQLVPTLSVLVLLVAAAVALTRQRARRNATGRQGERLAARQLARMPDADIFHDVSLGGENADSILLTPEGIYTIEVKNWAQVTAGPGGVFSRGQDRSAVLAQARRQAGKVAQATRARVTPVVVFVRSDARVRSQEVEGVTLTPLRALPSTLTRLRRASHKPLTPRQHEVALQALQALVQD